MFSRKDSKQIRELFWISFAKSFPRRWMRYQTGLSGVVLKFHFDMEKAMVALDLEGIPDERRHLVWDRLLSLKSILIAEYLPDAIYDSDYLLENNTSVSRIYVQKNGVCIHDKNTWQESMLFLKERMTLLEDFIREFYEVLDA